MLAIRRPGTTVQLARLLVGAIFLTGSFTHFIVALLRPELYQSFGEWAPLTTAFFRDIWNTVVLENATAFGLVVSASELVIAVLVLSGGRRARFGLFLAVVFHVKLAAIFGLWPYALPATVGLAALMRYDFENAFAHVSPSKAEPISIADPERQREAA